MHGCSRGTAVLLSFLFMMAPPAAAQWQQTSGPGGGYVTSLTSLGGMLVAGTDQGSNGSGIWCSTDAGASWTQRNNGFGFPPLYGPGIFTVAVRGTELFASSLDGTYRSTDSAATWTKSSTMAFIKLHVHGGALYGAAISPAMGVYRSTDNGTTWDPVLTSMAVNDIVSRGTALYAGGGAGVLVSQNGGVSWDTLGTLSSGSVVQSLAATNRSIIAGTGSQSSPGTGLYLYSFATNSWSGPRIDSALLIRELGVNVAGADTTLFASVFISSDRGVYRSTDHGATWLPSNTGLSYPTVLSLLSVGGTMYAGTYSSGVFRSTDNGVTWTPRQHGMIQTAVYAMTSLGTAAFAGTMLSGTVYRTTDNGSTWAESNAGIGADSVFLQDRVLVSMHRSGTTLFAGMSYAGIYRSTDNGTSWVRRSSGLPRDPSFGYGEVKALTSSGGSTLFAALSGSGVFRSTNNGDTWTDVSTGLSTLFIQALASGGTTVLAGNEAVFFRSTDLGATWTKVDSGLGFNTPRTLIKMGPVYIAGTTNGFYRSTDDGVSWTEQNTGYTGGAVQAFHAAGGTLFASVASFSAAVLVSKDTGRTWEPVSEGLPTGLVVPSLTTTATHLLAGVGYAGVWRRPLSEILTNVRETPAVPAVPALEQNFPNPFNPVTEIRFSVDRSGPVTILVYDMLGRRADTVVEAMYEAGRHSVRYDAGRLASGVYVYRLEAGNFTAVRRMVLLR